MTIETIGALPITVRIEWLGGHLFPLQQRYLCTCISDWQKIYEFDPYVVLSASNIQVTPEVEALVLGAEVAMWTETVSFHLFSL